MDFKKMAKELVAKMTLEEKMAQMRFDAPAIERLGIPAHNYWNEALHSSSSSSSSNHLQKSKTQVHVIEAESITYSYIEDI